MNFIQQLVFNLIQHIRPAREQAIQIISSEQYCNQENRHQDFYCYAEKPFIEQFK